MDRHRVTASFSDTAHASLTDFLPKKLFRVDGAILDGNSASSLLQQNRFPQEVNSLLQLRWAVAWNDKEQENREN